MPLPVGKRRVEGRRTHKEKENVDVDRLGILQRMIEKEEEEEEEDPAMPTNVQDSHHVDAHY